MYLTKQLHNGLFLIIEIT